MSPAQTQGSCDGGVPLSCLAAETPPAPCPCPMSNTRCDWCCSKAPHFKNNQCSSCSKREMHSLDQEYKSNMDRSTSYLHVVRWVTLAGGCTHKNHQQLIDEVGLRAQTGKGALRSCVPAVPTQLLTSHRVHGQTMLRTKHAAPHGKSPPEALQQHVLPTRCRCHRLLGAPRLAGYACVSVI